MTEMRGCTYTEASHCHCVMRNRLDHFTFRHTKHTTTTPSQTVLAIFSGYERVIGSQIYRHTLSNSALDILLHDRCNSSTCECLPSWLRKLLGSYRRLRVKMYATAYSLHQGLCFNCMEARLRIKTKICKRFQRNLEKHDRIL